MDEESAAAVPLEKNSVRFIENLSKGTRGARSCEQFLESGYRVIMVVRDTAEKPFGSMVSARKPWFDVLAQDAKGVVGVRSKYQERVSDNLRGHNKARKDRTLLTLEYSSIFEYLVLLEVKVAQKDAVLTGSRRVGNCLTSSP